VTIGERRGLIADLEMTLEALVGINERILGSRHVPPLAVAAVRYEAASTETWRTIPAMLESGRGDAEDFACWRAAELRAQGKRARVVVIDRGDGALTVAVRTAAGDEDPIAAAAAPASSSKRGRK